MDDIDETAGETHPTPVALITDRATGAVAGAVARLLDDVRVVAVEDIADGALPGRAVLAVADPGVAAALLDRFASDGRAPDLRVAVDTTAGVDRRVLASLGRFDALNVVPDEALALVTVAPATGPTGTAARWVARLAAGDARQATRSSQPGPARAAAAPQQGASAPARAGLRALAGRVAARPRLVAAAGLLAVLAAGALALVAFPGNVAAALLVATLSALLLGVAGVVALGYRGIRRTATDHRVSAEAVAKLTRRVNALENGIATLRAAIGGATATSAASAVATRELLGDLQRREDALDTMQTRLAAIETSAASTLQLAGGGARAWDITKLHDDLLNDQQALAQLLARYQPEAPLPAVSGWAMNPTGLLWLVDLVERTRPGVVVECGSGTSTFWLATALRRIGAGRVVSLEHDPDFAARTVAMLERHDLLAWAEVRFCPLVEVATGRGEHRWYDVDPATLGTVDLLVVDGPPGATGPHARYPALPVLSGVLGDDATVVLDDTGRREEQEVLELWLQDDPALHSLGEVARGVVALRRAGA